MIDPMRGMSICAVAFVVLASFATAVAQPANDADTLFNEGRALLDQGKYVEACAKFEASLKLSDALGTRLNIALCMEKRNKIQTAKVLYEEAEKRAQAENQVDFAKVAREHIDALSPRIPRIAVQISSPVPGQRTVIKRPGSPDIEASATDKVSVDPTDSTNASDRVTVESTAPGYKTYVSPQYVILEKKDETIVVPALVKIEGDGGGGGGGGGGGSGGKSSRKRNGIIFAVGGALAIVGSGLWANSLQGKIDAACDEPMANCSQGEAKYGEGDSGSWTLMRYGATPLFVAGIGAIGVGAYLFLTAPSASETPPSTTVAPAIGPDNVGVSVTGRF
jgi:hypothetical protein